MRLCLLSIVLAFPTFLGAMVQAQDQVTVCPDPAQPCTSAAKTFAPYELTFQLPDKLEPNKDYKTRPFQAVILKTFPKFEPGGNECDGGEFSTKVERQRLTLQKLFPDRKVFAAHQCPDMGAVLYEVTGKPYDQFFIAVYGGETKAEAKRVLSQIRGKLSRPTIKEMQAVYTLLAE
ncbi:MAG: hypothetical protein FJ245_03135 [Nitrospira sp.]|nr:hypothetical protein [Nitrospira sp.]